MPNYVYRCAGDCELVKVSQKLSADPLTVCPLCESSSTRRAIVAGNMAQINTYLPSTDLDYFPSLARFPGDPTAHVSGPHSLAKVMDDRRRMGWTISSGDELPVDSAADNKKEAERKRKADFHKATGIQL